MRELLRILREEDEEKIFVNLEESAEITSTNKKESTP